MSRNKKLYGFFFICSIFSPLLFGEKLDDGCGHSVLGPESGVLASKNYPGTYPNNTWCEWKIRVTECSGVLLKFGDVDIEGQGCESDYVRVLSAPYGNDGVYGTFCGSPRSKLPELYVDSSEVTIQFRSGRHVSGRGFLLSYAMGERKDLSNLLTCLDKGSHFSFPKYRKYCPAGCKALSGDISGDALHGYRHTSSLCKAAIHAGVIQDEQGGQISVQQSKGPAQYPSARANGIQSKLGSLSDTLFTFENNVCKRPVVLAAVSTSASSWHRGGGKPGHLTDWSPNSTHPDGRQGSVWTADYHNSSSQQWLQLDLGEEMAVTDVVTTGSTRSEFDYYVVTYKIEYKEKNHWRTYKQNKSAEATVFEGNIDSIHSSRNTFQSPIVARYLRLLPQTWHQRIAMSALLWGCPLYKANLSLAEAPQPKCREPKDGPVTSQADLVKLAFIIVPIVLCAMLFLLGLCICKIVQKKKTEDGVYGSSDHQKTGCWKQIKQPFARHPSAEFTISYSSEKDPMQKLDLVTSVMAEYQQQQQQQPPLIGMGTVCRKGSTFRPMDTDSKDETNEALTHYDYLQNSNQYALPLTNQEPEYATPIIERHTFRKDGFLPDPSYSVPGVVLSKTPSFRAADCAGNRKVGAFSGVYQTPQVKPDRDRLHSSEGVYDRPKVSVSLAQNGTRSDYQKPHVKPSLTESYSTPRDCVKLPDQKGLTVRS